MPEMSLAENLLYSTIRLIAFKNDVPTSTGTGFMFGFAQDGERHVPCIVTNKHVIEGADRIQARLHFASEGKPNGALVNCDIFLGPTPLPIWHPDPRVDLCAIPFADIINQASSQGKQLFFRSLDLSIVPSQDEWQYFDALEEVLMIGCPNGLADEINNLPISRRGITATSLSKDYNGQPEFVVDMACFPGSSGSPIFLYDRNGYLDRKANSYMIGAQRLKLVGVLHSGPLITNKGQIILSHMPHVEVASMMHLGNAVKSSELRALDNVVRSLNAVPQPSGSVGEPTEA